MIAAEYDENEAIFVNIAGDIRPEDMSRLSGYLGITAMEGVHYEVKKKK